MIRLIKLIKLLIIAPVILSLYSCAGTNTLSVSFDPGFYASRDNLSEFDIQRLLEYSRSSSGVDAAASSLILGHYSYRHGNTVNGTKTIANFYNSRLLSNDMKLLSKLWVFDILIDENYYNESIILSKDIMSYKNEPYYKQTISLYCLEYDSYRNDDCFIDKLSNIPRSQFYGDSSSITATNVLPTVTNDNIKLSTLPTSFDFRNPVITIPSGSIKNGIAKGLIYGINKESLNYKIIEKQDAQPNQNTITIDTANNTLYIGENQFKFNYNFFFDISQGLNYIRNTDRISPVIVGTSSKYYNVVSQIATSIRNKGSNINVINFETQSFQSDFNKMLKGLEDINMTYIGVGDEDSIMQYLPYAQYHVSNKSMQKIYLIMDVLSEYYNTKSDLDYFKNVSILTSNLLIGSQRYTNFKKNYLDFFGEEPSNSAIVGYDMVMFIKWYLGGADPNNIPRFFFSVYGSDIEYGSAGINFYNLINNRTVRKIGL